MLYQTERLEQTELLENKNGDFNLKALKISVISAFDKLIQNKTHQKKRKTEAVWLRLWQGQEDSNPRPTVLEWLCALKAPRTSPLFRPFCPLFRQFKSADFLFDALLML